MDDGIFIRGVTVDSEGVTEDSAADVEAVVGSTVDALPVSVLTSGVTLDFVNGAVKLPSNVLITGVTVDVADCALNLPSSVLTSGVTLDVVGD